jgi:hypothetical protein
MIDLEAIEQIRVRQEERTAWIDYEPEELYDGEMINQLIEDCSILLEQVDELMQGTGRILK